MAHVAIVFFSATGHTEQMAHAVADGAKSVSGIEVSVHRILGSDIKEGRWSNEAIVAALDKADAIVFGTPTYMGRLRCTIQGLHRRLWLRLVPARMERQNWSWVHTLARLIW